MANPAVLKYMMNHPDVIQNFLDDPTVAQQAVTDPIAALSKYLQMKKPKTAQSAMNETRRRKKITEQLQGKFPLREIQNFLAAKILTLN